MTDQSQFVKIKRALISVSDKTGIVEFAQKLASFDVEILSTGGTFRLLKENNINAIESSDYSAIHHFFNSRVF